METILLQAGEPDAIRRAVETLSAGQPVALPTETVYGLAADAGNALAVASIFQAKERPTFDPLIVHLPNETWLERVAMVPAGQWEMIRRLAEAFWPGPLTLLVPRRPETVPDLVTAGSALVAVRRSAHPVFRAVIERFGKPLAAPSANRFGRISPTNGTHAWTELRGRIPLVLEAGPTTHGVESTIVAPESGNRLRVLRHGPVTVEQLAAHGEVVTTGSAAAARSAPGQVEGHYAPQTPLKLWNGSKPSFPAVDYSQWGLLAWRQDQPLAPEGSAFAQIEFLSVAGDLRETAAGLFAALRRLDEAGLQGIIAQTVPEENLGRAIMDRLRRAAAGSGT